MLIVGGSYSGISAAISLARFNRKVMIIDDGRPCNRHASQSNNFFTHDGDSPDLIRTKALDVLRGYPTVGTTNGTAVDVAVKGDGFNLRIAENESFRAKKIIFATGVRDIFPDILGFAECWGTSVVNCPYCHGYELGNRKTAVLENGEKAFQIAALVRNLTEQVCIVTQGKPEFTPHQLQSLLKSGIVVNQKNVRAIEHSNGHVSGLLFTDGSYEDFSAVYTVPPFKQSTTIPERLGCKLTESGHIEVDKSRRTIIPGVFACGDCTTPMRSLAYAVSAGSLAGAAVNFELAQEAL